MAEKNKAKGLGRKRSRILYEITVLIVLLMIVMGVLSFLFINSAFDRLIDKSVDKLVEEQGKIIHSGLSYVAEAEAEAIIGDFAAYTSEELIEMTMTSMETGEQNELGMKAIERLQDLVARGVLGLELVIEVTMPSPPLMDEAMINISNDEDFLFAEVPAEILAAIEEAEAGGESYVYLEEGLPALGLEGEYLISLYSMAALSPMMSGTWGVHFVSMQEAVKDINDFYDSEKNRSTAIIAGIIGGSVILIILITFFVLSYLIRKQITDPIDALAVAAGEVMEGNLDVDVGVHQGGDFENLERAFKEMVESFRKYIAKSTGEDQDD